MKSLALEVAHGELFMAGADGLETDLGFSEDGLDHWVTLDWVQAQTLYRWLKARLSE